MSIGSKNTNVAKILNAGRNLVARCIKYHGLTNVMSNSEDSNVILKMRHEAHQLYKKNG